MSRNRRTQSGAVRFVLVLKTILICTLIGGSGVGYVLQKKKLHELGRTITRKEIALERAKLENNMRANQLAEMASPLRLAERVRDQKLNLFPPQPGQTIWLFEPTPGKTVTPPAESGPLVAVRNP